ncbi:MAG: histidine kinase [Bacteroidales bacterium]|nr:histidine kinase [Bacteroidales bacterium]
MKSLNKYLSIKNWNVIELLVYLVIWSALIFMPLFFLEFDNPTYKKKIILGWVRIVPFFLIFIIHIPLLPLLQTKNRRLIYILSTVGLILIVNYIFVYQHVVNEQIFKLIGNVFPGNEDIGELLEHHAQRPGGPFHHGGRFRGRGMRFYPPYPQYLMYTYNVIISILIVGFSAAIHYSSKVLKEARDREEMKKEHLQSKLTALQNQISPHFFMNTLNNIHALVEYNKEDAKKAIVRLSKMMRYMLYDSNQGKTTLKKEIEFLKSYIQLMRLRINDKVEIKTKFPGSSLEIQLPPFLFISFIENAFKFGVKYHNSSYIHILLEITGNNIHFSIRNSKHDSLPVDEESGGIGLDNARNRMDLLFGKFYSMNIYDRGDEFEVDIVFPYFNTNNEIDQV